MKKPKNVRRVSTVGMPRAEWLEVRRQTIGGSEASAIVGLSKWASPLSVWAEKLGKLEDKPETEAMRMGRDLERYVAQRWMEATGKKVERVNAILYNDLYPFAHANFDRWVVGENAGLECKTTSTLNVRQFQGGEFPEQYYAQCVHYMAVTEAERWHLCVLVYGRGVFCYTLERDQAEIDALMGAELEFWGHVQDGTPPPVDGSEATGETLQTIFQGAAEAGEVELFGREGLLKEWAELGKQGEAIVDRMEEIKNIIKMDLGDAERGTCTGFRVSWKPQERKTFQAAKFAKDHPEMNLDPYYKVSSSRPFKIEIDEKEAV